MTRLERRDWICVGGWALAFWLIVLWCVSEAKGQDNNGITIVGTVDPSVTVLPNGNIVTRGNHQEWTPKEVADLQAAGMCLDASTEETVWLPCTAIQEAIDSSLRHTEENITVTIVPPWWGYVEMSGHCQTWEGYGPWKPIACDDLPGFRESHGEIVQY